MLDEMSAEVVSEVHHQLCQESRVRPSAEVAVVVVAVRDVSVVEMPVLA